MALAFFHVVTSHHYKITIHIQLSSKLDAWSRLAKIPFSLYSLASSEVQGIKTCLKQRPPPKKKKKSSTKLPCVHADLARQKLDVLRKLLWFKQTQPTSLATGCFPWTVFTDAKKSAAAEEPGP